MRVALILLALQIIFSCNDSSAEFCDINKDLFHKPPEASKEHPLNVFGLPVLPGVQGFGLDAIGGRGGKIIHVTNLNKKGEGSFKEAVKTKGPRIVVFDVAGVIDLEESIIYINDPYLTIAGQTAPSPGITIIKGGLAIETHDVIIQHIRVRPGAAGKKQEGSWQPTALYTDGAYNVIIDHCTFTWGVDENLSASGGQFIGDTVEEWRRNTSHKVTFSNCIIAQGLRYSTHTKGPHSMGTLVHDNCTDIVIYGNLYSDNVGRNPYFGGGVRIAFVNNYIYNARNRVIEGGLSEDAWDGKEFIAPQLTIEGNYFEPGPDSSKGIPTGRFRGAIPSEIYWHDTYPEVFDADPEPIWLDSRPVWPEGLKPLPSSEVKESVLINAGARPWDRDSLDLLLIDNIRAGKGNIIDSETEFGGGYPVVEPVYRKFNVDEWDMVYLTRIR